VPIILTYGTRQRFRDRIDDINVHGRVARIDVPVREGTWSLNGGAEVPFYVESVPDPGIDWTFEYKDSPAVNRLKDLGDFNIEIPATSRELREGPNGLTIRITGIDGGTEETAVAFDWDPRPLPGDLDLTDLTGYGHIQEVGQVVDGAFDLDRDQNLIRSRAPVYVDALLVLGSRHGSQEATYRVRFTDLRGVKWLGPSDFFAGHVGATPGIGIKPGWSTAGMMALNPKNEARGFIAYGDHSGSDEEWVVQTDPPKRFEVRARIDYRVRHQVVFGRGVVHDRFRIWPAHEQEPAAWLVEEDDGSIPATSPRHERCSFGLFQHSGFPIEWSDIRVRPI
jgi:hypothetical protein